MLPIAQYLQIAAFCRDPRVFHPGASAETVANTVTQVIGAADGSDGLRFVQLLLRWRGAEHYVDVFDRHRPDVAQVQAGAGAGDGVAARGGAATGCDGAEIVVRLDGCRVNFRVTAAIAPDPSDYFCRRIWSRNHVDGGQRQVQSQYAMRIWLTRKAGI
jgi:hypothetical protein